MTETAYAEQVMTVIKRFPSGARTVRIADGVEIGIDHKVRIYWATPQGWDWVIAPGNPFIQQNHIRVLGDSTGWPSTWDTEFVWTGPI
ncbi:hypothetical protein [Nonomuraea typhae]|uniref:hypothetical protein n=1 Tax=Nonomuraea typhae TaxID=2603600 RepID=UPI0012FA0391|nr:hypothetical protein [Nonomuraea typhae]